MNGVVSHRGPPYELILFDCDSTICHIEGIDALAERAGLLDRLRPITEAAMNGEIDFATAYAERLTRLQPDREAVDWLAGRYRETLLADATDLIRRLQAAGKAVHIVSGGIRQALLPLAEPLGLPVEHIHAVDLVFHADGGYAGYDRNSPLARQRGKAAIARLLAGPVKNTVLIGDGITDLEVTTAGIDFIGFGGVARRPAIEGRAVAYHPGPDLTGMLPLLLSRAEVEPLRD